MLQKIFVIKGRVPELRDRGHAAQERRPQDQAGALRVRRHPRRVRRLHLQRSVVQVETDELFSNRFLVFFSVAGRFPQGSSAISVMNLTFTIPKTVLLRFGIIQKCYAVVFLFLSISKFSTHENKVSAASFKSAILLFFSFFPFQNFLHKKT